MKAISVAITLGDPGGIGPELAARVAADPPRGVRPVLFGTEDTLAVGAERAAIPLAEIRPLLRPCPGPPRVPSGCPSKAAGQCALEALRAAVAEAKRDQVQALVTAPVSKESLALAGVDHRGHTGLLGELCGVERPGMVFVAGVLRVALLTTHIPLAEVAREITKESVLRCVRMLSAALERELNEPLTPIDVAALNPHLGEGGLLGREEIDAIAPAVAEARREGIEASGPHRCEELLVERESGREPRGVVALFHDQALVPLRVVRGREMVNVTVGLPVVRTSPDHGTGFDIVGTGIASPASMLLATRWARLLYDRRIEARERRP